MKFNIKGGLLGVFLISVLFCNILILNGVSLGLIVFFSLKYLLSILLFKGLKFGWWVFVVMFGILSILGFIHLFVFRNFTFYGAFFEILIILGIVGLMKKDIRDYYLKSKEIT
jgi:hypothetical protein